MFIWMNEKMGRGYDNRGQANTMWLVIIAAVAFFAAFMIPFAFTAGVISFLAVKIYELPGLKQAADLLLKLTCSKVVKGASDVVAGVGKGGAGFVGGAFDLLGDAAKGLGDFASDLSGWGGFRDVAGFVSDNTVGLLSAGFDATKLGIEQLQKLRDFACQLQDLVKQFKKQGLDQPFKAAISCKNWPEEWGEIDRDKDGKALYCLEDDAEGDQHSQIPAWLIPIYQQAGERYNVPWPLLAAINWNDTEFGTKSLTKPEDYEHLNEATRKLLTPGITRFEDEVNAFSDKKQREIRKNIQAQIKTMSVGAEWQVKNARKHDRLGWIPMSEKEWKSVRNDSGSTPLGFTGNPYNAQVACPMPVSGDGAALSVSSGETKIPPYPGKYPDESVPKAAIAQWMGAAARANGMPAELPVMAALVESGGLRTDLTPANSDADSGGFFQMRVSIWNIPPYTGYMSDPVKQLRWFIDQAKALAKQRGGFPKSPSDWGLFIADVERPAAQYRYRYQLELGKARQLLGAATASISSNANVMVDFTSDGQYDTCDPVDSIFGLARWLSDHGAAGGTWQAALDAAAQDATGGSGSDSAQPAGPVLSEGDSLAVGSRDELVKLRPNVTVRAEVGRSSSQGVADLKKLEKQDDLPETLVVQLGTNDANVKTFRSNVTAVKNLKGVKTIYWVNISRPPLGGVTDRELNKVLEEKADDKLKIIDWKQKVSSGGIKLSGDRIHATPQGYKQRAKLIADALPESGGASSAGFIWPSKTKTVISPFQPNRCLAGVCRPHEGVDIPVPEGTNLYAIADGRVSLVQGDALSGGYGNFTCIDHEAVSSCYAHQSRTLVKTGAKVKKGDIIGKSGCTGRCFGPHLHFEIRRNGRAIDPVPVLKGASLPEGGGNVDDGATAPDVEENLKDFSTAGFPSLKKMLEDNDGDPLKINTRLPGPAQPSEEHCKSSHPDPSKKLLTVYQAAGRTFKIDWRVLAAIVERDSLYGCETGERDGIEGWAAMSDDQWEDWGTDANADGKASRQNALDSIFSAARLIAAHGAPKDYRKALLAYRDDTAYVSDVLAAARGMGSGEAITVALNDLIGEAVQERNHQINRKLCENEETYVQCIARLYRKIEGEDPNADSGINLSGPVGDRIVELARAELKKGVTEVPAGSNQSPDIKRYLTATQGSVFGYPWCAYFVSYIAKEAGSPVYYNGTGHGAVAELEKWAIETKQWIPKGRGAPQPGDFIVFHANGGHIGIVETVKNGHVASTIEGNFSNGVNRGGATREASAAGFIRLKGVNKPEEQKTSTENKKKYGPYGAQVAG